MRLKDNLFNYFLILSSFVVLILVLTGGISVDIIQYKRQYPNLHKLLLLTFMAGSTIIFIVKNNLFAELNIYRRFLLFSYAVFVIALVFHAHILYLWLIGLVTAVLLNVFNDKKVQPLTTIHIFFFSYFTINLISIFWSSDVEAGIDKINEVLIFFYMPILFLMFKLEKKDIEAILLFFCRFMIIFTVLSLFTWVFQSRAEGVYPMDMFVTSKIDFNFRPFEVVFAWNNYYHPTYMSIGLNFGLALAFIFNKKKKITVIELVFLILAIFVLAIVTQSRFMFISWLVINMFMLLYRLKDKRILQISYIVAVSVFVILISVSKSDKMQFFLKDSVREAHYNAAIQAIKDTKCLGTGLGGMTTYINADNPVYAKVKEDNLKLHYKESMSEEEKDNLLNLRFIGKNPHNQFIGDLMQTGIIGLLILISFIAYLFYFSYKEHNVYLLSFLILFSLLMFIEMPLDVEVGICYFVIFISLLTQYNRKNEKETIS